MKEMMVAPAKGIYVNVYRQGDRRTFCQPGHGLPAMVDRILVLVEGGNITPGEEDHVFMYYPRVVGGHISGHLAFVYDIEPLSDGRGGLVRVTLETMRAFGGTYAGTSDSRFSALSKFYGAIPIHDDYHV